MFPIRLSIVTYNLWRTNRWPERQRALKQFIDLFRPDILCVQELCPETQEALDKDMPHHKRIHDDYPGWTLEGNIYWDDRLLELVEYGREDVAIVEENRCLFWARLAVRKQVSSHRQTILISTAHFTWQGNEQETKTGLSPRVEQTRRTLAALERLVGHGKNSAAAEPAFFMGDLNDPSQPVFTMHRAGWKSCFSELGIHCPETSPALPTANIPAGQPITSQTLDWLLSKGPARPLAAQSPHCFYGDIAPSDHWPVLAVYELQEG